MLFRWIRICSSGGSSSRVLFPWIAGKFQTFRAVCIRFPALPLLLFRSLPRASASSASSVLLVARIRFRFADFIQLFTALAVNVARMRRDAPKSFTPQNHFARRGNISHAGELFHAARSFRTPHDYFESFQTPEKSFCFWTGSRAKEKAAI